MSATLASPVQAHAVPTLPRRGFLRQLGAAALALPVAGLGAQTATAAPAATVEPELLDLGRRWALALAETAAAEAAATAAERRLAAIPVPKALRYRPGDRELWFPSFLPQEHLIERDDGGVPYYSAAWIEELSRHQRSRGTAGRIRAP